MNSRQIRTNLKLFSLITTILLFTREDVSAKMAAPRSNDAFSASMVARPAPELYSITEVIKFLQNKQSTKKLTEQEEKVLTLAKLGHEFFGITEVSVAPRLANETAKVESIRPGQIAELIQQKIIAKPNWEESIPKENLEKVNLSLASFKESLGESSYFMAWLNYQNGLKAETKTFLDKKFEAAYTYVMQMREVHGGRGSPLTESENLIRLLKPMSPSTENATREAQLQKMRMHISNLPNLQIMT